MQQESLDKILDSILITLDNLDIDAVDKIDLLVNLKTLLGSVDTYTQSINVLQRTIPSKKEAYKYEYVRKH